VGTQIEGEAGRESYDERALQGERARVASWRRISPQVHPPLPTQLPFRLTDTQQFHTTGSPKVQAPLPTQPSFRLTHTQLFHTTGSPKVQAPLPTPLPFSLTHRQTHTHNCFTRQFLLRFKLHFQHRCHSRWHTDKHTHNCFIRQFLLRFKLHTENWHITDTHTQLFHTTSWTSAGGAPNYVKYKTDTCQSITLSTKSQAATAGFVFKPYIYHIVYYTCITCISYHARGHYSSFKKYTLQVSLPGSRACRRLMSTVAATSTGADRRRLFSDSATTSLRRWSIAAVDSIAWSVGRTSSGSSSATSRDDSPAGQYTQPQLHTVLLIDICMKTEEQQQKKLNLN